MWFCQNYSHVVLTDDLDELPVGHVVLTDDLDELPVGHVVIPDDLDELPVGHVVLPDIDQLHYGYVVIPDDLHQLPDGHVVRDEELCLVEDGELLLAPKPLDDAWHLNNLIYNVQCAPILYTIHAL